MSERKKMTPKEFQEFGFLQEANRQFFHPLGLALAVDVGGELDEEGYFKVQVWDGREDPEGWFFLPEEIDLEKIHRVENLRASKRAERIRVASGVMQSHGVQLRD